MSHEQPKIESERNGNLEEVRSTEDILLELTALQSRYFQATTDEEKEVIELVQYRWIDEGKRRAEALLVSLRDPSLSEGDRDHAMGEYGYIMDQFAVSIPWSEVKNSMDQRMRDEALRNLFPYFEAYPKAKEVARWIFSLFHHGAGIDKDLTAKAWEQELHDQLPDVEFARQYVEAEERGRVYLEKYVALELGRESFSLETDYQELVAIDDAGMKEGFVYMRDVANWYGRIAEYQRIAGGYEDGELNAKRATELRNKLVAYESKQ
jgi:hypothetical protein